MTIITCCVPICWLNFANFAIMFFSNSSLDVRSSSNNLSLSARSSFNLSSRFSLSARSKLILSCVFVRSASSWSCNSLTYWLSSELCFWVSAVARACSSIWHRILSEPLAGLAMYPYPRGCDDLHFRVSLYAVWKILFLCSLETGASFSLFSISVNALS